MGKGSQNVANTNTVVRDIVRKAKKNLTQPLESLLSGLPSELSQGIIDYLSRGLEEALAEGLLGLFEGIQASLNNLISFRKEVEQLYRTLDDNTKKALELLKKNKGRGLDTNTERTIRKLIDASIEATQDFIKTALLEYSNRAESILDSLSRVDVSGVRKVSLKDIQLGGSSFSINTLNDFVLIIESLAEAHRRGLNVKEIESFVSKGGGIRATGKNKSKGSGGTQIDYNKVREEISNKRKEIEDLLRSSKERVIELLKKEISGTGRSSDTVRKYLSAYTNLKFNDLVDRLGESYEDLSAIIAIQSDFSKVLKPVLDEEIATIDNIKKTLSGEILNSLSQLFTDIIPTVRDVISRLIYIESTKILVCPWHQDYILKTPLEYFLEISSRKKHGLLSFKCPKCQSEMFVLEKGEEGNLNQQYLNLVLNYLTSGKFMNEAHKAVALDQVYASIKKAKQEYYKQVFKEKYGKEFGSMPRSLSESTELLKSHGQEETPKPYSDTLSTHRLVALLPSLPREIDNIIGYTADNTRKKISKVLSKEQMRKFLQQEVSRFLGNDFRVDVSGSLIEERMEEVEVESNIVMDVERRIPKKGQMVVTGSREEPSEGGTIDKSEIAEGRMVVEGAGETYLRKEKSKVAKLVQIFSPTIIREESRYISDKTQEVVKHSLIALYHHASKILKTPRQVEAYLRGIYLLIQGNRIEALVTPGVAMRLEKGFSGGHLWKYLKTSSRLRGYVTIPVQPQGGEKNVRPFSPQSKESYFVKGTPTSFGKSALEYLSSYTSGSSGMGVGGNVGAQAEGGKMVTFRNITAENATEKFILPGFPGVYGIPLLKEEIDRRTRETIEELTTKYLGKARVSLGQAGLAEVAMARHDLEQRLREIFISSVKVGESEEQKFQNLMKNITVPIYALRPTATVRTLPGEIKRGITWEEVENTLKGLGIPNTTIEEISRSFQEGVKRRGVSYTIKGVNWFGEYRKSGKQPFDLIGKITIQSLSGDQGKYRMYINNRLVFNKQFLQSQMRPLLDGVAKKLSESARRKSVLEINVEEVRRLLWSLMRKVSKESGTGGEVVVTSPQVEWIVPGVLGRKLAIRYSPTEESDLYQLVEKIIVHNSTELFNLLFGYYSTIKTPALQRRFLAPRLADVSWEGLLDALQNITSISYRSYLENVTKQVSREILPELKVSLKESVRVESIDDLKEEFNKIFQSVLDVLIAKLSKERIIPNQREKIPNILVRHLESALNNLFNSPIFNQLSSEEINTKKRRIVDLVMSNLSGGIPS